MDRTISVSGVPKRLFRYLAAGFAVFLLLTLVAASLGPFLVDSGVALPAGPTGLALFAVAWVGLTVLWVRRMRGWEGAGSFWGPIPDDQYAGRFAEAGGIARQNWERAVDRLPDRDGKSD